MNLVGLEMHDLVEKLNLLKNQAYSASFVTALNRYQELLSTYPEDNGSIQLQEFRAFEAMLSQKHKEEFKYRTRQLELVNRAFEIGGAIGPINESYKEFILERLARLTTC
jgi:hypothetical protein